LEVGTVKRAAAWSFSRLKTFESCPKQTKYKADKTPEIIGPAMERGSSIHKDAELFLGGHYKEVPATLQNFARYFRDIKRKKASAEEQVALTSAWKRTQWFAPDAWLRVVIDARVQTMESSATLIDFKTGRKYEDHIDQLELYAMVFFALQTKLATAEGELWYLDQGEIDDAIFSRDELPALQEKWSARAQPMLTATEFPAKPGKACRWCGFAASRGGPCKDEAR
jgi:hypothetical protein